MHTFPGNVLLCLSNSIPDFICWNWQQSGILCSFFLWGIFSFCTVSEPADENPECFQISPTFVIITIKRNQGNMSSWPAS